MIFCRCNTLLAAALFVLLNAAAPIVRAADAETRAFNKAEIARQDGFPDRAEKLFAEFIARFPASPRVAQALLLQSKAALQQRKFQPAIQVLTTNLASAAGIADQFQFAIANIYSESGQYDAAATNFALLVSQYTNSSLRVEATLAEARARFQLKQWPRVAALLQTPGGLFVTAAASAPESEPVVRGRMLLAEALLEQREHAAAEQVALSIPEPALGARAKWEREFLIAKARWGGRKLEAALATTSNLLSLATGTGDASLDAASAAMQGEILEALHRPDEAIAAYARNQRPGVPAPRAREALFKTVELMVGQGQLTNALLKLEEFVRTHPNENTSDIALISLAELRLKQHQLTLAATNGTPAPPGTDLLADVIFECEKLLAQFTNSPFLSRAHFIRGWALLAQGKFPDSLNSFRRASETLPWSESQAVARFKTADLQFRLGELTNALANYHLVLTNYVGLPRVQSELIPRARYQMLQASLAARDRDSAHMAMEAILGEYPRHGYAERALLLFGQALEDLGDPPAARQQFARFLELFPESPLRAEVGLAVARTFEREHNWPSAIATYDQWVQEFPTNGSLPRAEFLRATANFLADRRTNALTLFTNFVARFPLNPLAQRAQNWVGDFYLNEGNYDHALVNYQRVFENKNWPVTTLSYQARLKAGRAALLRPSFDSAAYHFTNLLEDTHCPTSVLVQAFFAWGDANKQRTGTNVLENFNDARKIYAQIPKYLPESDPFVPRAWGEVALCYFQLGTSDPANYADALEYYGRVTNSPAADTSTRQQAQVGIGHVFRAQAVLARERGSISEATALANAALTNYLDVVYPVRDETPDTIWVKEATFSAAEICQAQGEWQRAINLYERLREKIPSLRPAVDRRIEAVNRQMQRERL